MAGDIGFAETLILPVAGMESDAAPVSSTAAPVLHDYGPSVRIGGAGPAQPATMTADEFDAAPMRMSDLSANERLGLAALQLRETKAYKARKNKRPFHAKAWARGPVPLHRAEKAVTKRAPTVFNARPKRLAGRIAVGIIMVSGPGTRALKKNQQVKIAAEVQNGLSWLAAQSPAKDVTWVHDNHHVTVDVAQASGARGDAEAKFEHFEKPWRDAALVQMGFRKGTAGVKDYITALKENKGADAAYCAFFTLYKLNHFAYCTGPYLVMHYENDGWGIDNIDRVFAHESGHVVGAPDEYAESECDCGGRFGFFRKANRNCETCAPDGGVKCIMKANDWAMCSVTPYHLGYNGLPPSPPKALSAHEV